MGHPASRVTQRISESRNFEIPESRQGIQIASRLDVLHVVELGPAAPALPAPRWTTVAVHTSLSAAMHVLGAAMLAVLVSHAAVPSTTAPAIPTVGPHEEVRHIVFISRDPNPGGGGGGGGNRQPSPIRRAEARGADAATLRVAKPVSPGGRDAERIATPEVVLEAKPLAAAGVDQIGLPTGGVSFGTSTGPGDGGGVGEGVGTGIGPGRGSGIGPGSGGGIGGGLYRPGGAVTPPRVITEVKPTYTSHALVHRIQGTVVLELVVQSSGAPTDLRVVRSLDPGGLDEQALIAVRRWRFEPGRLSGRPVDVLVTVMLDFWIR